MKKNLPDNQLIWNTYNGSTVPGASTIYNENFQEINWKINPPETNRQLEDIGVVIVFNDQVDNDEDRYWSGWEIYNMSSDGNYNSNTPPLDWIYSDDNLTLDELESRVRRTYSATGIPQF